MEQNLESIITDFVRDLTTVFPEYADKFASIQCDDELRKYVLTVYPERFFDIVNCQLTDEAMFLPGVNFKELFEAPGLSESSKQTMWKYLQLILFSVVGSVDNASRFGESLNVFENMDETELQTKLQETFAGLEDFFKGTEGSQLDKETEGSQLDKETEGSTNSNTNEEDTSNTGFKLPNPEVLQEHMRTLMEGKIGKLAKELTEEFSEDMKNVFDETDENMDIKDVMAKFMKDPKKLMSMMKKITDRLQAKLKNGEISQDELMQEVASLVEKFKGLDKNGSMMEMFAKGPLAKMFAGMAGGQGLQMLQRAGKQSEMKERLRKKMELKQAQKQPVQEAFVPTPAPVETQLSDDQLVELFKKKRNKNKNKKYIEKFFICQHICHY
jgi:hypothetical protein